jgi:hypothetical protein
MITIPTRSSFASALLTHSTVIRMHVAYIGAILTFQLVDGKIIYPDLQIYSQ